MKKLVKNSLVLLSAIVMAISAGILPNNPDLPDIDPTEITDMENTGIGNNDNNTDSDENTGGEVSTNCEEPFEEILF